MLDLLGVKPSYHTGFAQWPGMSEYPQLWEGLVTAYAPYLGMTGSKLIDFSGKGNHGAFGIGAASPTWIFDKFGSVVSFDGGDYVYLPAVNTTDTAGTISIWVKFDDVTTQRRALFAWGSTNVDDTFTFNLRIVKDDDDSPEVGNAWVGLRAIDQGASTDNTIISTTTLIATGVWYHIVLTSDGSSYQIFVNGINQALNVAGGANNGDWIGDLDIPAGTTYNTIGAYFYKNAYAAEIDGIIANSLYYNCALIAAEIKLHHDIMKRLAA